MGSVAQSGDAEGTADSLQAKAKLTSAAASDAKSSEPGSAPLAKKAKMLKPDVVVEFEEWAGHKLSDY